MRSAAITKMIDVEQNTLWRLMTDMANYGAWQVYPLGKVANAKLTLDAGVIKGSERHVALSNGQWLDEQCFDAAAPTYIAYRRQTDSTGKFSRKYKDLVISIRMVGRAGSTEVTLSVEYERGTLLGRWFDIGTGGSWKRAFNQSLENLAEFAATRRGPELYTPTWREPDQTERAEDIKEEMIEEGLATEHAERAEQVDTENEAEDAAEDIQAELERLRAMQQQMREMGLSTEEIDARIAALEQKR